MDALPDAPGVYVMVRPDRAARGSYEVLYVDQSTNVRQSLLQHVEDPSDVAWAHGTRAVFVGLLAGAIARRIAKRRLIERYRPPGNLRPALG